MIRYLVMTVLSIAIILAQSVDSTSVGDTLISTGPDSLVTEPLVPLPELKPETEPPAKLPMGEQFFDYKTDLGHLQSQIDSLKRIIKVYKKKQVMPQVNKELLELVRRPEIQHRIILKNGTIILGEIISKSDLELIIRTNLGRLVINREHVVRIDEDAPPQAKVELIGDPFVNAYPDREEITGTVKNIGQKRADFVRIIANLWAHTTELAAQDSAFINGMEKKYDSGVITDSALKPNQTAKFKIIVPLSNNPKVEYRTYTVKWEAAK